MTMSEKEIYTGYHVIIDDTYKKYIKRWLHTTKHWYQKHTQKTNIF